MSCGITGNPRLTRVLALAAPLLLAQGCATPAGPLQLMQLGPQAVANREAQTRQFRDVSEAELLSACVSVLQDLGFRIVASDAQVGVITGSKLRSLEEVLLDIFPMALRAGLTFGLYLPPEFDLGPNTGFRVVLAMRGVGGPPRVREVRVTFFRTWVDPLSAFPDGTRAAIAIVSPALYRKFFAMLDASLTRSRSGN